MIFYDIYIYIYDMIATHYSTPMKIMVVSTEARIDAERFAAERSVGPRDFWAKDGYCMDLYGLIYIYIYDYI